MPHAPEEVKNSLRADWYTENSECHRYGPKFHQDEEEVGHAMRN